ncbi:MAG: single-stranded DNA-binding protein [Bacteroidota bacterium]
MASVNKVILIGNLGKDPEIKYLEENIAKVSFSLATSDYYKDKNGNKVEQTEWHHIVLWRALAESAEKLLKKGMQIYLEGKIQSRQWFDKEGNQKHITEIVGESYLILQKKINSTPTQNQFPNAKNNDLDKKDNLPF